MAPSSHKDHLGCDSGSSTIQASGQHQSDGIGKIDPAVQMWEPQAAGPGFKRAGNCTGPKTPLTT